MTFVQNSNYEYADKQGNDSLPFRLPLNTVQDVKFHKSITFLRSEFTLKTCYGLI